MPYIKSGDGRREALQRGEPALLAGELNYQIFYFVKHSQLLFGDSEIKGFVEQFLGEKRNYQKYNDMTGAIINCYIEIKRRLKIDADILLLIIESYSEEIARYEDEKIISNGDVE
jgi:hypothetical protein